ncbi:MAG: DGQHR domain-containing protein [Deltaproteobacteria bacterium]|nr:DGQHR domain-containing protein [Deltaproteobacteria bacterium]
MLKRSGTAGKSKKLSRRVPKGSGAAVKSSTKSKKPAAVPQIHVPAVDFSYNGHRMFVGVVPVEKLFPFCAVSRTAEDPEKGYQRHLAEQRARRIAEYLDDGNVIPGSIILSAQSAAALKYDGEQLSFAARPRAFLVIDGQHRLYGAHMASTGGVLISVCVLEGLSQEQEVQYFLDVNSTQRGVPRTLQLEIVKFLAEEGSVDEIRVRLFKALNEDPESPLCGRMSADKTVRGKLSHVPFKAAVEPRLNEMPLKSFKFESKVKLLIHFLRAVQRILVDSTNEDTKLSNAAFFQAMFAVFPDVVRRAHLVHGDMKEESIVKVIRPLRDIRWDVHGGTNKKAIAAFAGHLRDLLDAPIAGSEHLV